MSTIDSKALSAAELAHIVSAANECAENLLALLEEERDALSAGDVAGIDSSGQKKAECVAELESLEQERVAMCRALALTDADIENYLARHKTATTAGPGWQRLLSKLQECSEANAINGRITRIRRRRIEQALQILRGGAGEGPGLYGPNGRDELREVTTLGQA